jgi:hypothetical protein
MSPHKTQMQQNMPKLSKSKNAKTTIFPPLHTVNKHVKIKNKRT